MKPPVRSKWCSAVIVAAGAVLASVTGSAVARGDDGYVRQSGVDVLHYAFGLVLRDDTDSIAGRAEVEVKFTTDGLSDFALDLATPIDGRGMRVTEVTSEGGPIRFSHESNRLVIGPIAAPTKGESRRYVVHYHGVPRSGLRIGPNRHGERTFFSSNWPDRAHEWLPVIDHPSDKAESEFLVVAPAHYRVVANGLLQSETVLPGDWRQTHWKCSAPIATWLNALGVARFAVHNGGRVAGVPLQAWVYPQDRDAGLAAIIEPARQSVEFFSKLVGPYPYEKMGLVQAAGISGGMEHASAVFLGENEVPIRSPSLVAHEIAHQWFGDAVTERDWGDVWLSEGFATYFAFMFTEAREGRPALVQWLTQGREIVRAVEAATPGSSILHAGGVGRRAIPSPLVYQKGAWVLHMLRGYVGDKAFRAGIREYYQRYRNGNASTEDFRSVMEMAAGVKLDGFFRQWLERGGFPRIVWRWRYDPSSWTILIDLTQLQAEAPYDLPLEVGVDTGASGGAVVGRLHLTGRRQQFEIPAALPPRAVELDPSCWVLMDKQLLTR